MRRFLLQKRQDRNRIPGIARSQSNGPVVRARGNQSRVAASISQRGNVSDRPVVVVGHRMDASDLSRLNVHRPDADRVALDLVVLCHTRRSGGNPENTRGLVPRWNQARHTRRVLVARESRQQSAPANVPDFCRTVPGSRDEVIGFVTVIGLGSGGSNKGHAGYRLFVALESGPQLMGRGIENPNKVVLATRNVESALVIGRQEGRYGMVVLEVDGFQRPRRNAEFAKTTPLVPGNDAITTDAGIGWGKDARDTDALAVGDELSRKFPINLHFFHAGIYVFSFLVVLISFGVLMCVVVSCRVLFCFVLLCCVVLRCVALRCVVPSRVAAVLFRKDYDNVTSLGSNDDEW
mmetsp:Transcript_20275/g.42153  ORF Transcript_20275/g.42153 Transcript_20275/m.42153 type:complete len:349 (+) Transcript_20275:3588-4634(+)